MKKTNDILRHAAFFLNVLLIFLLVMENKITHLSKWMQFAGRLHPMVLHFPIALWIVALAFEWIGKKELHDERWKEKIEFLLSITALSAAAAAVFGVLLFTSGTYEKGDQLTWHKWLGAATSLIALFLVGMRRTNSTVYRISLLAGVMIIVYAGHLGAGITHGNDFLTGPLRSKRGPIADLKKALAFRDIIQPIFEEKCTGCHNPNKSKGSLQLTSPERIMQGGEDGAVIIPNNADSSLLYKYLMLPMNDEKHMPPEGKPQPDREEIALIHWWISNGADFKKQVVAINTPDSIQKFMQQKYGQASPLDGLAISFANAEDIRLLNLPDRTVRQLSADKPYIDVFVGGKKHFDPKDWEELGSLKSQVVSIDCSNAAVDDQQLSHISDFPHLLKLHLEHSAITDAGISALKKLQYLEYLNLSGTAVSSKIFEQLIHMPQLKKIYLYETNIDLQQIKQFIAAKPTVHIGYTPDLSNDTAFAGRLSEPLVKTDSTLFTNHATVEMNFRLKGVSMHYTTNGNTPDENSTIYENPLKIDSSCVLKVIASRNGWKSSSVVTISLFHAKYRPVYAQLARLPDKKYTAKLDTTLFDLEKGSTNHGDGKYLGFEGNDLELFLDLGSIKRLNTISVGYLVNHGSFLLSPEKVEIWGSPGAPQPLRKISTTKHTDTAFIAGAQLQSSLHRMNNKGYRLLKIKVINGKKIPSWHPSKGSKSWLFVDEIIIN